MFYDCKIYSDGSGFTAILPREATKIHRSPVDETVFACYEDGSYRIAVPGLDDNIERYTTRKEEFDRFFDSLMGYKDDVKRESLKILMRPFFEDEEKTAAYVDNKLKNKDIARQARSTRFHRKAYLNSFTYYCTFTYNDEKCSFDEFDKTLRVFFNNQASRHGWKIMMVPEWGKENGRYHFHALVSIPENETVPGSFKTQMKYNKKKRRMVKVTENSYFSDRWGLNDWQRLSDLPKSEKRRIVGYIVKYLTKTDASIYYSRGIPTFIKSHVRAEDIIARIWRNGQKAVLFDDWHCFYDDKDVGEYEDDYILVFGITG